MRYLIGNWKMETTLSDAVVLATALKKAMEELGGVEVVICPPVIWLTEVKSHIHPLPPHLHIGAQDGFYEEFGAYTGQIGMQMLKELCSYVLIGHSERKKYAHETPEESRKKIIAALRADLHPVVFIGEYLRPEGEVIGDEAWREISTPVERLVKDLPKEQIERLLLVYEPVWAVGKSGNPASPEYSQSVIERMRQQLSNYYGAELSEHIPLLYGGSVSQENAATLSKSFDGVVVGREAIHAGKFLEIAKAVAN